MATKKTEKKTETKRAERKTEDRWMLAAVQAEPHILHLQPHLGEFDGKTDLISAVRSAGVEPGKFRLVKASPEFEITVETVTKTTVNL